MAFSPKSKYLVFAALLLLAEAQVSTETAKMDSFDTWLLRGILPVPSLSLAPSLSPAPAPSIDCGAACEERCKLNSRHNLCMRACGTCCKRCNCVPPGQSGNKEVCGKCYTDMKTHGNRTKCP